MKNLLTLLLLFLFLQSKSQIAIKAINGNSLSDSTTILYNSDATLQYDFMWDGIKFPSQNGYPTVYTLDSIYWYSINSQPLMYIQTRETPLHILPGNDNNITLKLWDLGPIDTLHSVPTIYDRLTGKSWFIHSPTTISFSYSDSINPRFIIRVYPQLSVGWFAYNCEDSVDLSMGTLDTITPKIMYDIYNSTSTFFKQGLFRFHPQDANFNIPRGICYIKLLFPQDGFQNGWVKTLVAETPIMPEITGDISISSLIGYLGDTIRVTPQFNPDSLFCRLLWGDGLDTVVESNIEYSHIYNSTGDYSIQLYVKYPGQDCYETFSKLIKIYKRLGIENWDSKKDPPVKIWDISLKPVILDYNNLPSGVYIIMTKSGRWVKNSLINWK